MDGYPNYSIVPRGVVGEHFPTIECRLGDMTVACGGSRVSNQCDLCRSLLFTSVSGGRGMHGASD